MSPHRNTGVIVKKYGGATLATPEKIKRIAQSLFEQYQSKQKIVVIVSAMGNTTNSLLELAKQVSAKPIRRELDMLLTTGERVSTALMAMALNDLGCPAMSLTGSQAGILTDDSHQNAFIIDVKPVRVQHLLSQNKIVVLAGFQGVSPITKEITTLGRGGTDTTAVAMASALNADACEILKDVPAVFDCDPNQFNGARELSELTYSELLDMAFGGAKVLHYRSVELALRNNVPLFIGSAEYDPNLPRTGTWVRKERITMFETPMILAMNLHAKVLNIECPQASLEIALNELVRLCHQNEIALPQILVSTAATKSQAASIWCTGPQEVLQALTRELQGSKNSILTAVPTEYSGTSLTCTTSSTPDLLLRIVQVLGKKNVPILVSYTTALGLCLITKSTDSGLVQNTLAPFLNQPIDSLIRS